MLVVDESRQRCFSLNGNFCLQVGMWKEGRLEGWGVRISILTDGEKKRYSFWIVDDCESRDEAVQIYEQIVNALTNKQDVLVLSEKKQKEGGG